MSKPKATFSLPITLAAQKIVKDQIKICSKRLKLWKLDDSESLHDLRVEMRRLRSYLRMFRLYLPESCKKERKQLEQLFKLSNENREADVHKAYLSSWLEREKLGSTEQEGMGLVIAQLDQEFEHHLAPNFGHGVRDVLDTLSRKLKSQKASDKDLYCHEFAAKVIATYNKQLEFYLTEMYQDEALLHKARITTKRLRYFLEALKFEPLQDSISDLKGWQDHLGKIHDFIVLEDFVKEVLLETNQSWLNEFWRAEATPKTLPPGFKQLLSLRAFIKEQKSQEYRYLEETQRQTLLERLESGRQALKDLSA